MRSLGHEQKNKMISPPLILLFFRMSAPTPVDPEAQRLAWMAWFAHKVQQTRDPVLPREVVLYWQAVQLGYAIEWRCTKMPSQPYFEFLQRELERTRDLNLFHQPVPAYYLHGIDAIPTTADPPLTAEEQLKVLAIHFGCDPDARAVVAKTYEFIFGKKKNS